MAEYVAVARAGDLGEGDMTAVVVDGQRILVARVEGELYAIAAVCTHGEANLDEGFLDGCNLTCPLHFGCVDVRTGLPTAPPIVKPSPVYAVKEEDGMILVSKTPQGSGVRA